MKNRPMVSCIFLSFLIFAILSDSMANPGLLKSLKKDIPIQQNKRRPTKLYKREHKNSHKTVSDNTVVDNNASKEHNEALSGLKVRNSLKPSDYEILPSSPALKREFSAKKNKLKILLPTFSVVGVVFLICFLQTKKNK